MLQKFISIRNVGKFKNSAAQGDTSLLRHTFILGANGQGKSTLCAILRSLKTQKPDYVLGRSRLGANEQPYINLRFAKGPVTFDNAKWSTDCPDLAIFDSEFVAENVHSGEIVDIDHKRNLYRVIVGEQGVQWAKEESRLSDLSRETNSKIKKLSSEIKTHIPEGMALDGFIALPNDPEIEEKCVKQEKVIKAASQAEKIKTHEDLSEYGLPTLPDAFKILLSRTLDDIAQDSATLLDNHLKNHGMETDGGNWIAKGMEYGIYGIKSTCPFCGQNVREEGRSLIRAYQAVFSGEYKKLQADITSRRSQITERFGEQTLNNWHALTERNKNAIAFWGQYCDLDSSTLIPNESMAGTFKTFEKAALSLLRRKDETPLAGISPDVDFEHAEKNYKSATTKVGEINNAIQHANVEIQRIKDKIEVTDLPSAQAEIERLKAIKTRHTDSVNNLCMNYIAETRQRTKTDDDKKRIRAQLNAHSENVMKHYESRINQLLENFNARFQISQTKHNYMGGKATSSYQLVINNTSFDLGDARTSPGQHSFKNTLSSGDRATLALAFFFTNLENDPTPHDKIVVFDDPFNSQDAFRRRQTIHEINRITQMCSQVIVLSHDVSFLVELWNKAPSEDRKTLNLVDHRANGSKIMVTDLNNTCKGRTAQDIDDLQSYVTTGTGSPQEIIRKIRVVLESYCWTTYPNSFQTKQDSLGGILRKIREGGDEHPAKDLYEELDMLNGYTQPYHHGEDRESQTSVPIDKQELTGFVKRTLSIVNALPT